MPKNFSRADRVAQQIQRDIAELIRGELDHPKAKLITVTDVEVTRDYSHAKVFYTVLNSEDLSETQSTLERASGWLRSEIARGIRLFTVPELHFVYDESVERGMYMDRLLDQVAEADAQLPRDDDKQD